MEAKCSHLDELHVPSVTWTVRLGSDIMHGGHLTLSQFFVKLSPSRGHLALTFCLYYY